MDEKPKRRWFRFRLSTVLILTAILAWGMACRPRIGINCENLTRKFSVGYSFDDFDARDSLLAINLVIYTTGGFIAFSIYVGPVAELAWPALALAAFLAWKAAWAVVERGHRRMPAP